MPSPQLKEDYMKEQEEKTSLKGTFVSVTILGIFILVTWLGVWSLYLSR